MMLPVDRLSEKALSIFLFHGVVEKSTYLVRNYTKKHIEEDYFENVISDLKKHGTPLSMDEVVDHYTTGKAFPFGAFAVTFDDGFENNYSVAAPILEGLEVPATFYITTSFIEYNTMSWIDRLEYCLEYSSSGCLSFPWSTEKRSFSNVREKIDLLDEIRLNVKHEPSINVDDLVNSIFEQCGLKQVWHSDDPLDKKMNWTQLRRLNENPLFIVGGHTHTHTTMSFMTPEELENEVSKSLMLLQKMAGISTRHYSYPEGLSHCYTEDVISVLKQHGIVCSPTAIDGVNTHLDGPDGPFHMKRIMVA